MAPAKDGNGPTGLTVLFQHKADAEEYPGIPSHTGWIVATHIVDKFMQLGSVIGLMIATPISYYRTAQPKSFLQIAARNCGRGFAFGLPLGMLAVIGKSQSMDSIGLDDRAYRLLNNPGQLRTDRFFSFGSGFGALVGWSMPGVGLLGGAGLGSVTGLLAHVITSGALSKPVKPSDVANMVKE